MAKKKKKSDKIADINLITALINLTITLIQLIKLLDRGQ